MARKHLSRRERAQKARIALPASTIAPLADVRYTARPTGRREFTPAGGGPLMASTRSLRVVDKAGYTATWAPEHTPKLPAMALNPPPRVLKARSGQPQGKHLGIKRPR